MGGSACGKLMSPPTEVCQGQSGKEGDLQSRATSRLGGMQQAGYQCSPARGGPVAGWSSNLRLSDRRGGENRADAKKS